MKNPAGLIITIYATLLSMTLAAETTRGCFAGLDTTGQRAWITLTAERYGDYYEVYGQVTTTSNGVYRIKADGWSGTGRLFRRHEGESGAVYIKITHYTGASLVLHVQGLGSFPFQAVSCR